MSAADGLQIESRSLRAVIAPALGGSLLRLDWTGCPDPLPILLPSVGDPNQPTARAMFVMLPWCNRIGGEGLQWMGKSYPMPVQVPGQDLPIHGIGLHRSWNVTHRTRHAVQLELLDAGTPPFHFRATISYAITDQRLRVGLKLTHLGPSPAPYGLGFHPWLCCGPDDLLDFKAQHLIVEDSARLPLRTVSIAGTQADFRAARPLPTGLINGTCLDWNGRAGLERRNGMSVSVRAQGAASRKLHIFARSADAGFVCLEPVSHSVDSTNRPMRNDAMMTILNRGQNIRSTISIEVWCGNVPGYISSQRIPFS